MGNEPRDSDQDELNKVRQLVGRWKWKGPLYDPPYESPLEDLFAYNIVNYLDESVNFQKQVEVETICGTFRIDFVASHEGKKVAFECDGKDFHDLSRDEWRDTMILGAGVVEEIYRLRGSDIQYHLEDCLYLISQREPDFFSERGHINLERLASDAAKSPGQTHIDDTSIIILYDRHLAAIVRHYSTAVIATEGTFLSDTYKFAREYGGGELDEVIVAWRARQEKRNEEAIVWLDD